MISINDLNKSFGNLKVLSDINIQNIDKGVLAVLGPNGSGKTTLLKCILGMVIPDSGTIEFNAKNVIGKFEYRKTLSYMPQLINFPENLKLYELFDLIKNIRNDNTNDYELIDKFGLHDSLNKKISSLSGGTKQKSNIVVSFMNDSPVIILDEPTTGLDPLALLTLKNLIKLEKEKGKLIIVTSHITSFIEEISDKIVFLLDGEIYYSGTLKLLLENTSQNNLESAMAKLIEKNNHV
jgi:Cu-processing system ATP-binding protein